ncbi:MAG: hypothetical protein V1772_09695 [Chloroflexota bacterium]
MARCCICQKELNSAVLWVCLACQRAHSLATRSEVWPAWARSELERERSRRRARPSFGVSGRTLPYAPYRRHAENSTYRRVNQVRRPAARAAAGPRVDADNLFYSTGDGGENEGYTRALGGLPADLREALLQRAELKTILHDAVRSLPLISQRAIRGEMNGLSVAEMAAAEGVSERILAWLLGEAKQHLADLLMEKVGADDGTRFV